MYPGKIFLCCLLIHHSDFQKILRDYLLKYFRSYVKKIWLENVAEKQILSISFMINEKHKFFAAISCLNSLRSVWV